MRLSPRGRPPLEGTAGHSTLVTEARGDLGFSSYMVRLPDEDLSVIVLSNLGTGRALDRARAVLDILVPKS